MKKSPPKRIPRIPLENEEKGDTIEERSNAQERAEEMVPVLTQKKFPVIMIAVAVGVVVIGIAVARYVAIARELEKVKSDPAKVAQITQEEQRKLVEEVGKIIALPDETPTVATVSDAEKLRNQPFFSNAQNGDKVLIFTQSKKAYLYRPGDHKVIDVAPITFEATASAGTTTNIAGEPLPTPTPGVYTVILRNGTTIIGLTRTYESVLSQKEPNLQVKDRENAARSDYEKTILVDVAGDKAALAGQFASELGIGTGNIPDGEPAPEADFLIILGSDVQQ